MATLREIIEEATEDPGFDSLLEPLTHKRGAREWPVRGVWLRYDGGATVTLKANDSPTPRQGDIIVDEQRSQQMLVSSVAGFDGVSFTLDCRSALSMPPKLAGPAVVVTAYPTRPPRLTIRAPRLLVGERYRFRLRRSEEGYWHRSMTTTERTESFLGLSVGAWVVGATLINAAGAHTAETEQTVAIT